MSASHPLLETLLTTAHQAGILKKSAVILVDPFFEPIPIESSKARAASAPSPPKETNTDADESQSTFAPLPVFESLGLDSSRALMVLAPVSKGWNLPKASSDKRQASPDLNKDFHIEPMYHKRRKTVVTERHDSINANRTEDASSTLLNSTESTETSHAEADESDALKSFTSQVFYEAMIINYSLLNTVYHTRC